MAQAAAIATNSTASVNSSRLPVLAMAQSSFGYTRRPMTSITTKKAVTFSTVRPMAAPSAFPVTVAPVPSDSISGATTGSNTSTSTITRSSTTSQPTAIFPSLVSSKPRASSALSSTTVEATDSVMPNTRPAPHDQSHQVASPKPIASAAAICSSAPGSAMPRTFIRSSREKCRPTPNISSITPISASWLASAMSAT